MFTRRLRRIEEEEVCGLFACGEQPADLFFLVLRTAKR